MKIVENALPLGTVLDSGQHQYRIVKVLGQGGFGITYQAVAKIKVGNVKVDVPFAVKEYFISSFCWRQGTTVTIPNASNAQEVNDSLKSFLVEAERLNRLSLDHDGLVKVNECFQANDTAYYVMEFISGRNLRQLVEASPNHRLSEAEALPIIQKVADAVSYLHQNQVTHLDIKPDNILLRDDGTPVLIDFGLAKHYDRKGNATSTLKVAGCSDGYSPLEQYAGITRFSPESDVYALAATLLYMLTGKDPRKAIDITPSIIDESLPSDVSETTRNAIIHAMQMIAQGRTQTVRLLMDELNGTQPVVEEPEMEGTPTKVVGRKYEAEYSTEAEQESYIAHDYKDEPKHINWTMIFSILGVCLLVGFLLFVGRSSNKPEGDDEQMTAEEMNKLAFDYYYGTDGKAQDYAAAAELWRKSADQGDASGQLYIGMCYEQGLGVNQNSEEAFRWYKKSAEQGNVTAQHNLGCCYVNGEGVEKDDYEAVKWFRKAAEQGDDKAQSNLGWCYENGHGVPIDIEEAKKWYRKSAAQGNENAKNSLKKLGEYN